MRPASPHAFLAAGLALALLAGCSGRERNNPFDPANPENAGRPPGFAALAGDGRVTLIWQRTVHAGLTGYTLWRRGPGDADFQLLVPLFHPDSTRYEDVALANDSTYVYRIAYVLSGDRVREPAEAAARPGPTLAWVADAGGDAVVRVTPDARHRLHALPGLDTPAEVEADPVRRRVWASSRTLGFVAVWEADGRFVTADGFFRAPSALAPVPFVAQGWVAEERTGDVVLWNLDGSVSAVRETGGVPVDLELITSTGDLWVADRLGKVLHRYPELGAPETYPASGSPWRLAHDGRGGVWVAYPEQGLVERRDALGAVRARVEGLASPYALAADTARAVVWVSLARGQAVICLDQDGREVARATGIPAPRGLAVDPRRGEVWVTSLGFADGQGTLRLLDPQGLEIARLGGFVRPVDVAVAAPSPTR